MQIYLMCLNADLCREWKMLQKYEQMFVIPYVNLLMNTEFFRSFEIFLFQSFPHVYCCISSVTHFHENEWSPETERCELRTKKLIFLNVKLLKWFSLNPLNFLSFKMMYIMFFFPCTFFILLTFLRRSNEDLTTNICC